MKIGIISDIHSNIYAFKACTEYMEKHKCDEYFFLGDYISDTPYTRETMDYLYEFMENHTCYLLRGNREEYMLTQQEARKKKCTEQMWISNSASGNLLYTYGQLVDKDFDFFRNLPITLIYEKAGYPSITCCHGSPASSRELLQLNEDPVKQWLEKIDTDYMICAHTHYPGEMTYKNKHYFNSGSVGISIDDAGYAQCMLLESGVENGTTIWKPQFLKVPYDNQKVAQDMITGGLLSIAPWFVNSNILTILTGIDCSAKMVELAEKLALEDNAQTKWPHIDEKYFEEALTLPEDSIYYTYKLYAPDEMCKYLGTYYAYNNIGDAGVDAWDYCRCIRLFAFGYICGYISYDEYLIHAAPLAVYLQNEYDSWETMYESYYYGYLIFAGRNKNSSSSVIYSDYRYYEIMADKTEIPFRTEER
jgi:predicted phosphodiesterase